MDERIVFIRPDGGTTVRTPVENAMNEGETKAGFLKRLADDAVASGKAIGQPIITPNDPRPQSRVFRNAWTLSGATLDVDMVKAKAIHMDRIREARDEKLKSLDNDWMKATGQNKKVEADAVEAKRQSLRDIPQTFNLNVATPEELEKLWPDFGE